MNKIVVANLKNNLSTGDIDKYLNIIDKKINSSNVIICPTSIYLPYFLKHNFQVGAQDIYYENDNCTGEVTPKQYKSFGVTCSLIGHSERRSNLKESDDIINKKVLATLENKMGAILCIGETLEDRSLMKTDVVLKRQIFNALIGVHDTNNLVIAYEPVWAIGSNRILDLNDIDKTAFYIKALVKKFTNVDNVMVLYGGSVNPENVKDIINLKGISGVLVGSQSKDPNKLLDIIEVVVNQ